MTSRRRVRTTEVGEPQDDLVLRIAETFSYIDEESIQIILPIVFDDAQILVDNLAPDSLEPEDMFVVLADLGEPANVKRSEVEAAIRRVASEFVPFTVTTQRYRDLSDDKDEFVGTAIQLESAEVVALKSRLSEALENIGIDVPQDRFQPLLFVSESPLAHDRNALNLDLKIANIELMWANAENGTQFLLGEMSQAAYFVASDREDCDAGLPYAVVREESDDTVSCHATIEEAELAMEDLIEQESTNSDEILINLNTDQSQDLSEEGSAMTDISEQIQQVDLNLLFDAAAAPVIEVSIDIEYDPTDSSVTYLVGETVVGRDLVARYPNGDYYLQTASGLIDDVELEDDSNTMPETNGLPDPLTVTAGSIGQDDQGNLFVMTTGSGNDGWSAIGNRNYTYNFDSDTGVFIPDNTNIFIADPNTNSAHTGTAEQFNKHNDDEEDMGVEWQGPIVFEGLETGDRRIIDSGALGFRRFPLPFMSQPANLGHDGAQLAGSILEVNRQISTQEQWDTHTDNTVNELFALGDFDESPAGEEAKRLLNSGRMRGVSVDMDAVEVEIEIDETMEDEFEAWMNARLRITKGRIMGATFLPFPAFQEASIEIVSRDEALVASGNVQDDTYLPEMRFNFLIDSTQNETEEEGN